MINVRLNHLMLLVLCVVSASAVALPPVITSQGPDSISLDDITYSYQVEANDPEAGALSYVLSFGPAGMTISDTGEVVWPLSVDQVAEQPYQIDVTDPEGLVASELVKLKVIDPNNAAPVFSGTPVNTATIDVSYQFDVHASDANGDVLTYSIASWPQAEGLSIDTEGVVNWVPTTDQVGEYWVWIIADDQKLGTAELSFSLQVQDPNNNAPVIENPSQDITINVGQPYQHQIDATDIDNNTLTYELQIWPEPDNASISTEGVIDWTPTLEDVGEHRAFITVSDGRLGTAEHNYKITVVTGGANLPPAITSTPVTAINEGSLYQYDVEATDPNGDVLSYGLVTSPTNMTIDADTGEIAWYPSIEQVGINNIEVVVEDGRGGSDIQTYDLNVVIVNGSPVITSTPVESAVVDQPYLYNVIAEDPDDDGLDLSVNYRSRRNAD